MTRAVSPGLIDGLREMIIRGRLAETDIPEDWEWLLRALADAHDAKREEDDFERLAFGERTNP